MHQALPVASPAIVGRESKEDRVVVDSLFANIQLSTTPTSYTTVQPVQEDVNQSLRNFPVAGWGDQTHHVVCGGDQKTHPVAISGDQMTHPVPVWGDQERNNPFAREGDQSTNLVTKNGDQKTNPAAGRGAEKKVKCGLCGETLPAGPEFLRMHNHHYHYQEVIELD